MRLSAFVAQSHTSPALFLDYNKLKALIAGGATPDAFSDAFSAEVRAEAGERGDEGDVEPGARLRHLLSESEADRYGRVKGVRAKHARKTHTHRERSTHRERRGEEGEEGEEDRKETKKKRVGGSKMAFLKIGEHSARERVRERETEIHFGRINRRRRERGEKPKSPLQPNRDPKGEEERKEKEKRKRWEKEEIKTDRFRRQLSPSLSPYSPRSLCSAQTHSAVVLPLSLLQSTPSRREREKKRERERESKRPRDEIFWSFLLSSPFSRPWPLSPFPPSAPLTTAARNVNCARAAVSAARCRVPEEEGRENWSDGFSPHFFQSTRVLFQPWRLFLSLSLPLLHSLPLP